METIRIPIYSLGKEVNYQGRNYNIERVVISGYNISLTINGMNVKAEDVWVEPTVFALQRI